MIIFLGKVTAGVNATKKEISNAYKSAQRSGIWNSLGVFDNKAGRDAIAGYCDYALSNGTEVARFTNEFGVNFTKQISLTKGDYTEVANVSFILRPGKKVPEVTTITFPNTTK